MLPLLKTSGYLLKARVLQNLARPEAMEEDILSDVVPSNIVSRQVCHYHASPATAPCSVYSFTL